MWSAILSILLLLSLVANGVLSWYILQILKKLWTFSDGLKHLLTYMTGFSDHIKSVYEMDLFYGDETLQALLRHSRDTVKFIKNFGAGFMWADEQQIYQQEGDEEDDAEKIEVGEESYFGEEEE